MSAKYPIIAITGSSGSGSSAVTDVFDHIAWREKISHLVIDGSAFHRYDREEMTKISLQTSESNESLTHFGPKGNRLDLLQQSLEDFSSKGEGLFRHYVHTEDQAKEHKQNVGEFTDWQEIPQDTALLVYQGLHGAYVDDEVDIVSQADLVIGMSPIVNLEWTQKIHTDMQNRGYSLAEVRDIIQYRLHDYVHYITPQFSRTDINFQRIPTVDTSNPFIASQVPDLDESMVVIRFNEPEGQDFLYLMKEIEGSFMTRRNTIVVPGGKMSNAMELILNPIVHEMMEKRRQLTDA